MIWQFNHTQLEDALKEWVLELEDNVNPESATIQADIVREFLNSATAYDHGLGHKDIVKPDNVEVKPLRTGKTVWNEGFNAFINKMNRSSNSYRSNGREWVLWREGWDDAYHNASNIQHFMS